MAYQTRCSKGADDGVSSAAQMEPGRERMQSISPPTFQPTPSCFHSLTVLSRWEWNSGKWTGRRAGTEMIARKPVITDRVRAESTGPVINMCTWCQDSCSFVSGNSLGHVGVFLPCSYFLFSFPCPWTYKFPIFAFFSRPVPHHVERTLHSRKGHHPVDSTQWGLLLCCAVFRWVFQHRLQVIFILFCFILFCLMQKKDGYFCPCGSVCRKKNVQVVPSCVQCEVSHPSISDLDTFLLKS